MQDVFRNIEEYNPGKKRKVSIIFDDMIADMISNKKLSPIVKELFIGDGQINTFLSFIIQSYFKVPKEVKLTSTHFFIMKIPNKTELQQTAINNSSVIEFIDSMKIYEKYTARKNSFLVNDTIR